MTRSMKSRIVMAVLAIGTLGAAAVANAATAVHLSVGTPAPLYVQSQPLYEPLPPTVRIPAQVVYDAPPAYAHDRRYEHERSWRSGCRAPGWEPSARYMPGQRVWRNGSLFVATRLSASVWNVNSPPEWTPTYWVPVRCR